MHHISKRRWAALAAGALALSLLAGCVDPAGPGGSATPTPTAEGSATPTPIVEPTENITPTPGPSVEPSVEPSRDPADDPQAGELDEHGASQDPDVAQSSTGSSRNKTYSENRYNAVVQQIIGKIITDDMTPRQKCRAIYDYVKGHVYYTGSSDKSDWKKGAYSGFVNGTGDCYTYYACCRALLTELGIDNMEVQRYGSSMPTRHYWNLVDYGEGWYHMDACPHLKTDPRFDCFMATDQELINFSAGAGREYYYFDFDSEDYPERVGGAVDWDNIKPMPDRKPKPTTEPTAEPTTDPGVEPTFEPGVEPTAEPGVEPTVEPGVEPTAEPGVEPTADPGVEPTVEPGIEPTAEPTVVTAEPGIEPTVEPTTEPTAEPTVEPAVEPTAEPTAEPTEEPLPTPPPEAEVQPTETPPEVMGGEEGTEDENAQ